MLTKSKLGYIFAATYIVLSVLSFFLYLYLIEKTPLGGLYIGVLTFPWSYVGGIILIILGLQDSVSDTFKSISLAVFVIVNTFIVFHLGVKTEKSRLKFVVSRQIELFKNPADKEPIDVLHEGSVGRVLRSRYFNKTKYYCIKLPDGRKGYVKSEGGIKVVKKSQ